MRLRALRSNPAPGSAAPEGGEAAAAARACSLSKMCIRDRYESDPTGFDYWEIFPGQGNYFNPDFITPGKDVYKRQASPFPRKRTGKPVPPPVS